MSYDKHIPWGWNPFLESFFESYLIENPGESAGRVVSEERGVYRVIVPNVGVVYTAQVSGSFRHRSLSREDFPAVGDWVCLSPFAANAEVLRINALLPRRTCLMRKAAGTNKELQIFASQIDEVLLVSSCNLDFNERRLDRALALVSASKARARVVLSKSDLITPEALETLIVRIEQRFPGVAVSALSSVTGLGMQDFYACLLPQQTYVVLGSSGVGKSTLLNSLIGSAKLKTQDIRDDDHKGRHTTVSRSMHTLANGALVIDTPGIRELQLFEDEGALERNFSDITDYFARCRFTNCRHESEPGCAVKAALAKSEIDSERWESYLKLQREMAFEERKVNKTLASDEKKKWAKLSVGARERTKFKRGKGS